MTTSTYRLYEITRFCEKEDIETLLSEIGVRVKTENNKYRNFGDVLNDITEALNGSFADGSNRFCDRISKALAGKEINDFELRYICDIPDERTTDEQYIKDCASNRINENNYCALVKFYDGKFHRCIKVLYTNPTLLSSRISYINDICRRHFR